jgi:hypothetical protein
MFIVSLIILSTVLFIAFSSQFADAQSICDNQIIQSAGKNKQILGLHRNKHLSVNQTGIKKDLSTLIFSLLMNPFHN